MVGAMRRSALLACVLELAMGCGGGDGAADAGASRVSGRATDAGAPVSVDAAPPSPGSWSVIVLPDTQILARDYPEIFEAQTRWIAEQRSAWNIQFVLHVGDVVDDDVASQWDVAAAALHSLDGVVPYVLAPGNHDYGLGGSASDRSTMLSAYFPVSTFASRPSFGGTFADGAIDDSFHVFDTPAGPWLVVALEFGPRDEVVAWADEVIERHAMPTILVTHAYLYSDDTRYDWVNRPDQEWSPRSYGLASLPGGANDGEEMFDAFVRENDDVDLVVCGHVLNDGIGRLTSEQAGGGRVHQLLANYQHQDRGGAGFLRIMTFDATATRVDVHTYSPYLEEWRTDPDNEFSLEL